MSGYQAPRPAGFYSGQKKKKAGRIQDPARRYQPLLYNQNCYML